MPMEEDLWMTAARSRALQGFRQEIAGRWNDEASRSISICYLDPHERDDQRMLDARCQQHLASEKADAHLMRANHHAVRASELSRRVEELVEQAFQEMRIADQQIEIYLDHDVRARALMFEIEKAIKNANGICQGVPTQ
jgi:hypothetical protein